MTEANLKDLIKKVTVRIEVSVGENIERGTGVLIKQNGKFYILTVHHCIYGKFDSYHDTKAENISF